MLEYGKITNTHGIKGEVKVIPWCEESSEFENFEYIFIDGQKYYILGIKYHSKNVILKLKGIDSISNAEPLINKVISVTEDMVPPLPKNTYYIKDLIGLTVQTEDGELLGIIEDIFKTGSNDVYDVKNSLGKRILIPAIRDVVLDIQLQKKLITVKLLEGLSDL